MLNRRTPFAFALVCFAPLSFGTLPFLPAGLSALRAAPSQNVELQGMIRVADVGGKKIPQITTADGRVYTITGKLEKMIRDQYAGRTMRLSGRIEREPTPGNPGIFRVEEIAIQLN